MDQDIEDSSQVIAFRTKPQEHLQEILYGKSRHTCKYQLAWPLIASVRPLHVQAGDAEDKGIDEHEYENANRGFHVQRTMYKAVYRELNQACVRYFQLDSFVCSLFW